MNTDVQQNSSTAIEAPEFVGVPNEGDPGYDHWRKTGEYAPDVAPKKEESATSKAEPSEATTGGKTNGKKAESAPASEAGKENQEKPPKRSNAETRLKELLAENKRLKAEAQEREKRPSVTQADSSTAKPRVEQQPVLQELKAPVKPKKEDFADKPYEEWEAAREKYFEELSDYNSQKAVREYQQQQRQQQQQQLAAAQLAEGRQRYQDFDSVIKPAIDAIVDPIVNPDKHSPGKSQNFRFIQSFLDRSPVMADVLYVIGSNKADLDDFVSRIETDPWEATRILVRTEGLVIEELNRQGKDAKDKNGTDNSSAQRGSDGKFKSTNPPEKKITAAPPIGTEVGSRNTAPPDELQDAVERGDTDAYNRAANAADLKRRKRG